jgi:OmpA-OmpF porin, OOP family
MFVLLAMTLVLGAEPVRYELSGNEVKLPAPIAFETNSAKLKPESDAVLEFVKGYLEAKSYLSLLRVEMHSDSMGDERANQKLSEERAAALVDALVKKGVACERLLAVGFGGNEPIADNTTPEGRALNRRAVFANASLRGRPIGGMPIDGGGKVVETPCAAKK